MRKGIPVAGGMAGGSADAAAALVACDALWGTACRRDELLELAAELGSDVPFALARRHRARHRPGRAAHPGAGARHAGTGCSPSPTAGCPPRTVYASSTGCGTSRAGRRRHARRAAGRAARGDPTALGAALGNDLQAAALACARSSAHAATRGATPARSARMVSGSGPTCAFLSVDAAARAPSWPPRCRRPACGRRRRARPGRCPAPRVDRRCPRRERRPRSGTSRWPTSSTSSAVSQGYGTRPRCSTDVTLGVGDGERIGVVGRNGGGKTTLLRAAHRPGGAGRRPGHHDRRPARSATSPRRDGLDRARPSATVVLRRRGRPRVGRRRRASARWSPGSAARDSASTAGRHAVRRRAPPGRAGRAAARRSDLLVLDEPTNHLDVEGVAWLAGHLLRAERRAGRRHPRPLVPRRGVQQTWEVADGDGAARTRAATRRTCWPAPSARGRRPRRGPAAEPAAQGAGLAASRPAGAHGEAEVPHRRGQRADRRRAAAARPARAAALRHPRLGKQVYDLEDVTSSRSATARCSTHVTWRLGPGRPGRHGRGQRGRQDHAAAAARRRARAGRRPGHASADRRASAT